MGDYGEAGRPLRRSPFLLGLLFAGGALVAFAGFEGVRKLSTIIAVLVAATFFTLGLERPVRWMARRGLRRGAAVAVLSVAILAALTGFVALVIPALIEQVDALLANLPEHTSGTRLGEELSKVLTPAKVTALASGLLGAAASVAGALFLGLTTVMLTLFLIAGWDKVMNGVYHFVVASRRERVRRLGDAMLDKVGAYLVGAVTIAVCAATATFLWCVLLGVPYPLVMAIVVGIFDMIPQVGATIGSTVVILVALTVSLPLALVTLAFFCAYQGIENWIVYPRLMSRAVKISNLAAILCALFGGALFGILGVLIAVPCYASLQLLVREVVFPRQDAR